MSRPVFGENPPPLEPRYPRDLPCGQGNHLVDGALGRCTECGYFLDDLCWVDGCQEVTHGEVCEIHAAFVQPEARA